MDIGHYQRTTSHEGKFSSTKIGYGLGMRIETRLGLIGIDYGIGEDDGLLNGKIHVGIVNRF